MNISLEGTAEPQCSVTVMVLAACECPQRNTNDYRDMLVKLN